MDNGKIAVIDTENKSTSLYAGTFDFDLVDVEPPYTVGKLVNPAKYVLKNGYDVLIIDSASNFWDGV